MPTFILIFFFFDCKFKDGKILKNRGIDSTLVTRLDELLRASGLSNITHEHRSVGVGWGPSNLGLPFKEVGNFITTRSALHHLLCNEKELMFDNNFAKSLHSEPCSTIQGV